MAAGKKPEETPDSTLKAVQSVYHARKGLTPDERSQVLASVRALVEVSSAAGREAGVSGAAPISGETPGASRRLSLVELVHDKKPSTNAERIALFAYYREHIEGHPHFERDDLRPYFVKARIAPPTNYDRDFVTAVTQGWIHEEGADSYLTNSGTDAVESGFSSGVKSGSTPRSQKGKRKKSGARRQAARSVKSRARGRSKRS
jgi:hypothetical protein